MEKILNFLVESKIGRVLWKKEDGANKNAKKIDTNTLDFGERQTDTFEVTISLMDFIKIQSNWVLCVHPSDPYSSEGGQSSVVLHIPWIPRTPPPEPCIPRERIRKSSFFYVFCVPAGSTFEHSEALFRCQISREIDSPNNSDAFRIFKLKDSKRF